MRIWKIAAWVVVAGLLGWLLYANRESINKEAIIAYGKSLPAAWFVLAFLILPLVGFPLSIFLILAGIRFGLGWGMAVTTACIYFHHLAGYWISHSYLNERLRRLAEKRGHKVPEIDEGNRVWYTILFASVHGPPYAFKLYLLALTGVPFRIYCWVGGTVYILFCFIPVGAAAAAVHMDVTWIYVGIVVISAGVLLGKWIRKRKQAASDKDASPEKDS
ncbi:MAG: hypothetical protein EOP87_08680 [Verrucomicrobiaceae bacterium]|nr:MAG: hypothetical protein EOP87_08680 [Verrucomicrobiaceae bacterium]